MSCPRYGVARQQSTTRSDSDEPAYGVHESVIAVECDESRLSRGTTRRSCNHPYRESVLPCGDTPAGRKEGLRAGGASGCRSRNCQRHCNKREEYHRELPSSPVLGDDVDSQLVESGRHSHVQPGEQPCHYELRQRKKVRQVDRSEHLPFDSLGKYPTRMGRAK